MITERRCSTTPACTARCPTAPPRSSAPRSRRSSRRRSPIRQVQARHRAAHHLHLLRPVQRVPAAGAAAVRPDRRAAVDQQRPGRPRQPRARQVRTRRTPARARSCSSRSPGCTASTRRSRWRPRSTLTKHIDATAPGTPAALNPTEKTSRQGRGAVQRPVPPDLRHLAVERPDAARQPVGRPHLVHQLSGGDRHDAEQSGPRQHRSEHHPAEAVDPGADRLGRPEPPAAGSSTTRSTGRSSATACASRSASSRRSSARG